jgi:hypothetical protein
MNQTQAAGQGFSPSAPIRSPRATVQERQRAMVRKVLQQAGWQHGTDWYFDPTDGDVIALAPGLKQYLQQQRGTSVGEVQ